ncbi:MAG TPA: BrnT family toxin [Pyrinomonadaceae bacterium]|nr:BrnT family toxin [Pyrinomonadaceae bacterium]
MKPIFEWDEEKAKVNLRKHKVSFDEAETVFDDPLSVTISDPDHSKSERRFLDIGESENDRIIVVSYTQRGSITRLISARVATRTEREKYAEENA